LAGYVWGMLWLTGLFLLNCRQQSLANQFRLTQKIMRTHRF